MSDFNIDVKRLEAYSTRNKMKKILKAYNRLHNIQDYNEEYRRNEDTYDMLKDIEIIQPEIKVAFIQEKASFLEIVEAAMLDMHHNYKIDPGKELFVRIGKWWELVLGNPISMALPLGLVKFEKDSWGQKSTFYYEGEGYSSTRDCDKIVVVQK